MHVRSHHVGGGAILKTVQCHPAPVGVTSHAQCVRDHDGGGGVVQSQLWCPLCDTHLVLSPYQMGDEHYRNRIIQMSGLPR